MFFGNSWIKFGNSQYKKKECNQEFSVRRVQKQWSLAKLSKITFILFECHRSIDKCIDFLFFSVIGKEFIVTKSSVMEIQNLVVNPNQSLLSRTLNNTNFCLSKFPAKVNDEIFKTTKKLAK